MFKILVSIAALVVIGTFAPAILIWGGVALGGAAVVGGVVMAGVAVLGAVVLLGASAHRAWKAGSGLPLSETAKGLAIIFGPLVGIGLSSYAPNVAGSAVGVIAGVAWLVGAPWWMVREFRRKA